MATKRLGETDGKMVSAQVWWTLPGGLSSLNQDDRHRIQTSFQYFNKNKLGNGARFFARFFKNNPSYQELFPALNGVSPEHIAQHRFLLCVHVDRFFVIFEDFLNNMYNTQGLHDAVYGMLNSKSHIERQIQPIHCQNMLTALLETLVEILKEEKAWSPETEISWKKFMAIILATIREEISDAEKTKHPNGYSR